MRFVKSVAIVASVSAMLSAAELGWPADSTDPEAHAHQPLTLGEGRVWLESDGEPQPLDDVGAFCLECHGPAASAMQSHTIGPSESSHPTGVAYPAENPEYRAIEELDSRILLSEGQVTCLSCHAFDAPDHRPVLPVAGGDLCQACHLL